MIISASRRSDIPAFYSRWFLNRVRAGEVYVRNPFNTARVSRVSLRREHVDFIHFWTKNPAPLLKRLYELEGYDYCFHFTLNGYGPEIEPSVPATGPLIDTFRRLADRIGKRKVAWRYCPVLIRAGFGPDEHLRNFSGIAAALSGFTERCHISLLDHYPRIMSVIEKHGIRRPTAEEEAAIVGGMVSIAGDHGIQVYSCADTEGLSGYGVIPGRCLDPDVLMRTGKYRKDPGQRTGCLCASSVDIGAYSTCPHNCLYCYANRTSGIPASGHRLHDPLSPIITGQLSPSDIIGEHHLSARASKSAGPTLF